MRDRGASLQAPEKMRPTYTTYGVAEGAWTLTKKEKGQLVLSFRDCYIPENKHRIRSESDPLFSPPGMTQSRHCLITSTAFWNPRTNHMPQKMPTFHFVAAPWPGRWHGRHACGHWLLPSFTWPWFPPRIHTGRSAGDVAHPDGVAPRRAGRTPANGMRGS